MLSGRRSGDRYGDGDGEERCNCGVNVVECEVCGGVVRV